MYIGGLILRNLMLIFFSKSGENSAEGRNHREISGAAQTGSRRHAGHEQTTRTRSQEHAAQDPPEHRRSLQQVQGCCARPDGQATAATARNRETGQFIPT